MARDAPALIDTFAVFRVWRFGVANRLRVESGCAKNKQRNQAAEQNSR
jgi:hypothetical protein